MCDLLGVSSRHPATLEMSFNSLMKRTEYDNPDGWGAVFYQGNDAHVYREPKPGRQSHLAHLLGTYGVASQLMISHIRKATTGRVSLNNTHPFIRELQGSLHSFAFNGDIPDIFNQPLSANSFQPLGKTDAEYAFCLLLEQMRSQQPKHMTDKRCLIKNFANRISKLGPVNFLYSDSRYLYAFASRRRHSDGAEYPPGLFWLQRCCSMEKQKPDHHSGLIIRSDDVSVKQQVTLISSLPISDEKWQAFDENQLLVIENGQLID